MKRIDEIQRCSRYDINADGVLVYVKDNNIYCNNIVMKGKYYDVVAYQNIVNTYDNNINQTQFFDIYDGELLYANQNFIGLCKNRQEKESDILLGQYEDPEGEFWIEFHTKKFEIVKKYPLHFGFNGIYRILANQLFLSRDQDKLWAYNNEGQILWQHNFCDLLQNDQAILHSEILEHRGRLYFFLSGSPRNRTFCIDIENGKVLEEYNALQGWLVKDGDDLYVTRFGETIVKLNTLTNAVTEWEVRTLLENKSLGSYLDYHRYAVQDGLVYFTQSMGVANTTVGIFDFNNRKLLWYHEFDDMAGAIGGIQVHGNRLFVHTQDNTLHVFERER